MSGDRAVISNSGRREFTRCRRRYHFNLIDGLEPIVGAPPLRLGTCLHDRLHDFYVHKTVLFDGDVDRWANEYREEVSAVPDAQAVGVDVDEEKITQLAELAKGMLRGYVEKYAGDHAKFEVVAAEKPFRIQLHVPCAKCGGQSLFDRSAPCDKCNSTGIGRRSPRWDYVGKIDLLLRDVSNGLLWIYEHKSTSESDPDSYMRNLELDTQPRGYVYAARVLANKHQWGKVAGIIYNVMRKKVPTEPALTKCPSCKGTGDPKKQAQKDGHLVCPTCKGYGFGGVSKAQTDTTEKLYRAALAKVPHADASEYTDILARIVARGDRFFWRQWHHVSDRDVCDWLLEMYQITRDINTTTRFYRNPDACSVNGRTCPYRRICVEDDPIARCNFRIRNEQLPELKANEIGF